MESFSLSLEAAVLLACDQPQLAADAILRLVDAHVTTGKPIVAARYDGHPGPPALFARHHFPELLELRGAEGAKPLFARHADLLDMMDFPELAVDLDTAEDYRKFVANSPSLRGDHSTEPRRNANRRE